MLRRILGVTAAYISGFAYLTSVASGLGALQAGLTMSLPASWTLGVAVLSAASGYLGYRLMNWASSNNLLD